MTGGYLTLDFSNIKIEGEITDQIASLQLGKKKGLYNFLKNNNKPIYVIFSESMMLSLYYYAGYVELPNLYKQQGYIPYPRTFLMQLIVDNDSANVITKDNIALRISNLYKVKDTETLSPFSIQICIDNNDNIYTLEI